MELIIMGPAEGASLQLFKTLRNQTALACKFHYERSYGVTRMLQASGLAEDAKILSLRSLTFTSVRAVGNALRDEILVSTDVNTVYARFAM
jgi:hypothetical protein